MDPIDRISSLNILNLTPADMLLNRHTTITMAATCVLLLVAAGVTYAGEWLLGDLSLTDDAGKRTYGQYISVFLTSRAIPAPRHESLKPLEQHQRLQRINRMHMKFFKTFSRHRARPGYLIAHTESSDTGNFAFFNIPPGDYFIVVTFPAAIDGYKVAWQQPVTVRPGRVRYISLNHENLAVPTDRR